MKNVYWLAIGAFLVATAELVVSGILKELAEDLGVTTAQAGQLVTAYSLGFAIGTPILIAATARAARKSMLLASLAAFVLASAASALSDGFAVLLALRVLLGVSAGVYCVVALGSIAKLVPAERIGSAIGTIALAFGSSMVLGVPIGIAMTEAWGWESIFYAMAGGSLLVIGLLKRMLPDVEGDAPAPFGKQFAVLGSLTVIGPLFLSMLWSAGNSVMLTYMAPLVQDELGLSSGALGGVLLALGLIGIVGSKLGGYGVDRFGSGTMLVVSLALSAASLIMLPLLAGASPAAGLALIGLWGLGMFVTAPALNAHFVRTAPGSANLVLGMNTSFTHLGLALGAGAGGYFYNIADSSADLPWLAGASLLVAFGLSLAAARVRGAKTLAA
ncbi:MFS transporter [Cohnella sp. GCM10027633]|uniref:MFS transporter n=1 Tax=unclassified Cohnella TaxID=2636738 RepID=UPI003645A625